MSAMNQPLAPTQEIGHTLNLHCTEGSSDKLYNLELVAMPGERWSCDFEYGRRGGTLNAGMDCCRRPGSIPASCRKPRGS